MTKDSKPTRLTPHQRRGIVALLAYPSAAQAAANVGCSISTMGRWLKDETFREELAAAEAEAMQATSRGLVGLAEKALTTLSEALDSGTMAQRLRASEIVLSHLLKLRELVDLEARLAALERIESPTA